MFAWIDTFKSLLFWLLNVSVAMCLAVISFWCFAECFFLIRMGERRFCLLKQDRLFLLLKTFFSLPNSMKMFSGFTQLTFTCSKSTINTKKKLERRSKLKIKTPERRHWRDSDVFIVIFKDISHLFPVFPLSTWKK